MWTTIGQHKKNIIIQKLPHISNKIFIVGNTCHVRIIWTHPHVFSDWRLSILIKNQTSLKKMKSLVSAMATCCKIWICPPKIWFSTVIRYVTTFVAVVPLDIRYSTIHYWYQYSIFVISVISLIFYVQWKYKWSPLGASTSMLVVYMIITSPIILHMHGI